MKAVIFDLDGVLCHTDQYHYKAWKELADRLKIPFSEQDNNALRGVSRMASLELILGKGTVAYTEREKELFAEEKNERYRAMLADMKPEDVEPGVRQTLIHLHESGVKLAVGSSSKNAPLILKKTGLDKMFDAIMDGTQIAHSKPDPEVFLLVAKKLGMPPAECFVVEDAVPGIEAAKAGGFRAIGIGDAASCPKADASIRALPDLEAIVLA
jgi:beta-phosphoglucomutase